MDEDRELYRLREINRELLMACEAALVYIERCVEPSCDEGDVLEDGTIHDGSTEEGNLLRAAIGRAKGGDSCSSSSAISVSRS